MHVRLSKSRKPIASAPTLLSALCDASQTQDFTALKIRLHGERPIAGNGEKLRDGEPSIDKSRLNHLSKRGCLRPEPLKP